MKAIGHLDSRGRALPCARGVGFGPIPADYLHATMLLEPESKGLGCTIRQ
jgi:hypothetical protein